MPNKKHPNEWQKKMKGSLILYPSTFNNKGIPIKLRPKNINILSYQQNIFILKHPNINGHYLMYLFVDDRGISHLNQSQQKHPTLYQNHAVIIAIDNIVPNTKSLKVIY